MSEECKHCGSPFACPEWCPSRIKERYARKESGSAVLSMIRAADRYQRAYFDMHRRSIADDGVLGPAFLDILHGIRALLNGELGTQDGGNLDRDLRQLHRVAGYEGEL